MSPATLEVPIKPERREAAAISIREVMCKTLLHKLAYRGSTGYTANLYKGCTHGCVYCYAPSLTHDERRWGSYVDAKVNAPAILEREVRKLERDEVFLSSASDPYQPVEAKYGLTRKCLQVLQRNRFPVSVLTRSPLVLRDLDLLEKLAWVKVGMSITTVPDRQFEPGVPPLQRRIETLKELGRAGIETFVSLAPVIPGVMMVDLDRLFVDLSRAGVSWVSFGVLTFVGYEESRKMFEKATGLRAEEALAGRDELVARISRLVERYGMRARDSFQWKPLPGNSFDQVSLETYGMPLQP